MEISFADKALRELCEKEAVARRRLGSKVAAKLKHRLADLQAADRVEDLVAGRPRRVTFEQRECYKVELSDGFAMFFSANHGVVPMKSGRVDWSAVSRVKLLAVERHDD